MSSFAFSTRYQGEAESSQHWMEQHLCFPLGGFCLLGLYNKVIESIDLNSMDLIATLRLVPIRL